MKKLFVLLICFSCLCCKAQQVNNTDLDNLLVEALAKLAFRKDNLEKNGPTIQMPKISAEGFSELRVFINDQGLNQLPDSTEWLFIKKYLKKSDPVHQNFDMSKVKRLLKEKKVEISGSSGLKNGFTPFMLNEAKDHAAVIYFDYLSTAPGNLVLTNRIIAFFKYNDGTWKREAILPLSLD